jgi:CheY-like chemotaxis protein/DNA-binding MarR family transcriptional regulator
MPSEQQSAEHCAAGAATLDVLIVDDDLTIASGFVEYLTRRGLKCRAVGDPWKALDMLSHDATASVVVSDIRMPELNGLKFAEHLRALDVTVRPELIFISGHAGFDDAVGAMRLQARDLLTKPVQPAALAAAVNSAISVGKLRQTAAASEGAHDAASVESVRRATVDSLRAVRKIRSKTFPSELFSDPRWEMLLDLYDAALAHKDVSVTKLAVGSTASVTTAWRRLSALVDHGLVERVEDLTDRRRVIVKLSDRGQKAAEEFFDTYSRHAGVSVGAGAGL